MATHKNNDLGVFGLIIAFLVAFIGGAAVVAAIFAAAAVFWGAVFWCFAWALPGPAETVLNAVHMKEHGPFAFGALVGLAIVIVKGMFGGFTSSKKSG